MRLEIDLEELGASLIAAPPEAVAIATKAKNARELDMPWIERLSLRAIQAEENLWDMVSRPGEESELDAKDRMKALMWYAQNHPETRQRPENNFNMQGSQVVINMGTLNAASAAAAECLVPVNKIGAIEGETNNG